MKTFQKAGFWVQPINADPIHIMILSDRRIGVKQTSEPLNISYERIHHSSYRFGYEKIFWKMNPKMTEYWPEPWQGRSSICVRFENVAVFLRRVVTVNRQKQQSIEWRHFGSSRPKKCCVQNSCFSFLGFPRGNYYWFSEWRYNNNNFSTLLTNPLEKIVERGRGKLFLEDTIPPYKSHVAMQIICDWGFESLEHRIIHHMSN